MDLRVASFNASLNRSAQGALIADLATGADAQARSVAEIIQRTDADVLLINEFDFDANGEAAALFQSNYLGVSQNGQGPIDYPYVYVAPSNTGVDSGFDLDNDGGPGGPGDAQGFGFFEGQFGFVIYSKYPIDAEGVRSFQNFLWKDMPGNLLTEDPTAENLADFYSPEEIEVLRLSSKNHVDVPVEVGGETVHILAAHPTPPVFDGPEDRNGKRNHDEIRFWKDYIEGADYIYDDAGTSGGLEAGERFVIVGDYNADPFDGDSFDGAINQILESEIVNGSATDPAATPSSEGGPDAAIRQNGANDTHAGNPAFDTADFGFNFDDPASDNPPGNLRVDYALPSEAGLTYLDGGVFWQAESDPLFPLAEFPTSDHRLVYTDLRLTTDDRTTVEGVEFLGMTEIESGFEFGGTTVGGLSGIVIDPITGIYLAVSDDRGAGEDGTPRFYEIGIDLSDGALDDGDVAFQNVTALTLLSGATFDVLNPDPEGIAFGSNGQLYISSERDLFSNPAIYLADREGVVDGTLPVDTKFLPTPEGSQGVRNNLGFESLTISPDQTTLWTATESALAQDGERSTTEQGSAARIVKYDLETGLPVAEYIYEVDPIAREPIPEGAFADSGLVELLALDDQGTLLALERSFSIGAEAPDRGYTGKLYLVSTRGATNVIGEASVPVGEDDGELEIDVDETVSKTLLADLSAFGIVVDNIEGMTLGPVLEDGRQSLVIVSDDNFSAFGPQANQFIALALDLGEVPTITPTLETPNELRYENEFDETEGPDPDDPAIWLNPDDAGASTVVTAMKNGGLRVYNLAGGELQRIEPEGIRYNNVDVLYDVEDGMDIAVASDRENDTLALFKIGADGTLEDITSDLIPDTIFGVDDGEATAYGLAGYTSPVNGKHYVFVTQADGNKIAQLQLDVKDGSASFIPVRMLELPTEGGEPADFQAEGIAIDRETGIGYVGVEEELGLLSFEADLGGSNDFEVIAPIDDFEPDIEGVSIYYGGFGNGLILVSSQGDATFRVYDRADHTELGSFAIRGTSDIDGVEESDGAEIYSGSLPGFEDGLLVTQDGSNEVQVVFPEPGDGEVQNWNVNFKYTDFGQILELFDKAANPFFDPRVVGDQPTPAMLAPEEGYSVDVALTIGETLSDTTGAYNPTTAGDYTPVGVIDGLGAFAVDTNGDGTEDAVRVMANHELLHFRGSEYEVSDGMGGSFGLSGARISYFDIDKESRQIIDGGIAYNTIVDANGEVASDNTFLPIAHAPFFGGPEGASQWQGFSRFCSGMLIEAEQFGAGRGLTDRIYFAGEEDGTGFNSVGGAEWALDVETGTMYQVAAMGRGAWENVTEIDTGSKMHVAFILADDSSPFDFDGDGEDEAAPLYLYVGEKEPNSDDFLARNGLAEGKLYVWVANTGEPPSTFDAIRADIDARLGASDLTEDETALLEFFDQFIDRLKDAEGALKQIADLLEVDLDGPSIDSPAEFNGTGNAAEGKWVEIDNAPRPDEASEDGTTGYDEFGYPTQGNLWLQAKAVGAFGLSRPEDVATNPGNGAEFVIASTGVDTYDIDPETGNGVDTFGTMYTMEVDFLGNGTPKPSTLKISYDGDDDPTRALRSPDNLDWADDGYVYVQEDEAEEDTASGDEILFGEGAANPNEAGIVKLDPKTGEITRIANIDRDVVLDPSIDEPAFAFDGDAGNAGEWESSGILDVSELFGEEGGSLFLASVQAHGIADQEEQNPESRITDGDLVEGGQLLFLAADEMQFV